MKKKHFGDLTKNEQEIAIALNAKYISRDVNSNEVKLWKSEPMWIHQFEKFAYGDTRSMATIDSSCFPSMQDGELCEVTERSRL